MKDDKLADNSCYEINLADNSCYQINEGKFTNKRLRNDPINHEIIPKEERDCIWGFLNRVSDDIGKALNDKTAEKVVRFNDKDYKHNTSDRFISVFGTDSGNFFLNTGNLIGFVKRDNYSLKIASRFGDEFLRYVIADADGFVELENFGGESPENDYGWLLAYLWNIKFKRAYRLGVPKAYTTKNDRTSRVRGTIDVIDYFSNRASGEYLCSYREHSYDGPAATLFIKAYEAVKHYTFCQRIRNIYNAFLVANQGVKRSRREILRTPHFTNPFYSDYNEVIDFSKRILTQQGSGFGSQQDSSSFFFDVSMLFEYFIRKLIKRDGIHLRSKESEKGCKISRGLRGEKMRGLEPDLVIECEDGLYVFDVKYKTFNFQDGVKREDLFQLHTYIGQYGNSAVVKGCGFIYPISEDKWDGNGLGSRHGLISNKIFQHRNEIRFHVLFLKIPSPKAPNNGPSDSPPFDELMREQCCKFMDTIKSILTQ